jgi:UDP-N-acetylglucosamine transferase subunit ALG13
MSTFVSVGNATQPFGRLLDAVAGLLAILPRPVTIQHGNTPFDAPGCALVKFMDMESFVKHVAGAEVLILHAGAGSIIHAVNCGKTPIVMPRRLMYAEHVDDHQYEFARAVAGTGNIVLAETPGELAGAVARVVAPAGVHCRPGERPRLVSMVQEALADIASRTKKVTAGGKR